MDAGVMDAGVTVRPEPDWCAAAIRCPVHGHAMRAGTVGLER